MKNSSNINKSTYILDKNNNVVYGSIINCSEQQIKNLLE